MIDFWTAFWIAIAMGLISWLAIKTGRQDIKRLIGIIGISAFLIPIIVIYLTGITAMNQANGTEETTKIAAVTIENLLTWFGDNILSIIASDFAGIVLGWVFSIFR